MRELVLSIARRSLQGLAETARPHGIRGWLESGSFLVEPKAESEEIRLNNIIMTEFISYQSFDFQRFALASLESLEGPTQGISGSSPLSWRLIKGYYAAFYASQAVIRSLGRSIFRLESKQAKKLNILAEMYYGIQNPVVTGTYKLSIYTNFDQPSHVLLKKILDNGRGSHEILWLEFSQLLDELATSIAKDDDEGAVQAIALITNIRSTLRSCGFNLGNWLSSIRNDITYRQAYNVWAPTRVDKRDLDFILRFTKKEASSIRLDFDASKRPLCAFFACSMCLAQLNLELCALLINRTKLRGNWFVNVWKRVEASC